MKKLLATLTLLGITFLFNHQTGTGFGFLNSTTEDATVIVRESHVTYYYSNGEYTVLTPQEFEETMKEVWKMWTVEGMPDIKWKIIRVLPKGKGEKK